MNSVGSDTAGFRSHRFTMWKLWRAGQWKLGKSCSIYIDLSFGH